MKTKSPVLPANAGEVDSRGTAYCEDASGREGSRGGANEGPSLTASLGEDPNRSPLPAKGAATKKRRAPQSTCTIIRSFMRKPIENPPIMTNVLNNRQIWGGTRERGRGVGEEEEGKAVGARAGERRSLRAGETPGGRLEQEEKLSAEKSRSSHVDGGRAPG